MSIGSFFSGIFGNSPSPVQNYTAQDPYVLANQDPSTALGQQQTEQQKTYGEQQGLAQALAQQAVAAGQGPSPSQTMLSQALSQNAANANGMASASRGHYSGMALRNAMMAQNQANLQAAGTGVAARQQEQITAQQQKLAALGQMNSLYGTMNNQNLQQQQLISGASLGTQGINANLATAAAQANGQAAGAGLGSLAQLGAFGSKFLSGSSGGGGDTGGIGSTDAGGPTDPGGGVDGGSVDGGTYAAHGGIIPGRPERFAAGGMTGNANMDMLTLAGVSPIIAEAGMARPAAASGSSGGGGLLGGLPGLGGLGGMGSLGGLGGGGGSPLGGIGKGANDWIWDGLGKINHGENGGDEANQFKLFGISGDTFRDIGDAGSSMMAQGGMAKSHVGSKLRAGGRVPGKAAVPGDSYANDTVDARLSPGEIVIPRSHAQNASMAKEFVDHLMSQKKKGAASGYGKVLEAHRRLGEALKSAGVK